MKSLSPGTSLIIAKVVNQYKIIGNATNLFVQTVRGKMPIYVFGKSYPQGIARGLQFIYGSIDMVQFDTEFSNLISAHQYYITPVEKEILNASLVGVTRQIFDASISDLGYSVTESSLDTIRFNELIFISLDASTLTKKEDVKYIAFKLNDVEFTSYSYAKSINNVTLLERIEFMCKTIVPVTPNLLGLLQ